MMAHRGGADLSWASDYGQFYLVDYEDREWNAPTAITNVMMQRRWSASSSGLVVYTNDCLQQIIEIRLHDSEPQHDATEWRSSSPWTQIETATATFPSKRFLIDSPSLGGSSYPGGPLFQLDGTAMAVRIS